MAKPVILTGLRANNDLHIGNYFGALLPIVKLAQDKSEKYQINLFVPDLHSFTTPIDHSTLQDQIMHNLKLFVAAGLPLNNNSVHIYRQSYIPAHSELAWILECFTGYGEMGRMTQFKDKSAKLGGDRVGLGLFSYPVLMAADILLYDTEYVPVGDDQNQHIEFARDIALRMNTKFGADLFTVPKPVKEQHKFFGKDQGLRIKDLSDPTKKMSKSEESSKGGIFLTDDPAQARKKVMSATTDDLAKIKYDPANQPGISNLLQILAIIKGDSLEETVKKYEGQTSYGTFKTEVADEVAKFLTDFQKRLAAVKTAEIEAKLKTSEEIMNKTANSTLLKTQKAIGLR